MLCTMKLCLASFLVTFFIILDKQLNTSCEFIAQSRTNTIYQPDQKIFRVGEDIWSTPIRVISHTIRHFMVEFIDTQWYANNFFRLNGEPIQTNLKLGGNGKYSVLLDHAMHRDENFHLYPSKGSQIYCEFNRLLKIILPSEGNEEYFVGNISVIDSENNSSVSGDFEIRFKEIGIAFITKPKFNLNEPLPNDAAQIDINFGHSPQIDLNIVSDVKSVAMEALADLADEMKLYLKTKIYERLTHLLLTDLELEFSLLFGSCMHPTDYPIFILPQQNYYHDNTANELNALNIKSMTIEGLSNFNFINITDSLLDYFHKGSAKLRIDNVNGKVE